MTTVPLFQLLATQAIELSEWVTVDGFGIEMILLKKRQILPLTVYPSQLMTNRASQTPPYQYFANTCNEPKEKDYYREPENHVLDSEGRGL